MNKNTIIKDIKRAQLLVDNLESWERNSIKIGQFVADSSKTKGEQHEKE